MYRTIRIHRPCLLLMTVLLTGGLVLFFLWGIVLPSIPAETAEPAGAGTASPPELRIVMYHGLIKDKSRQNQYMIDPEVLESDLRYLCDNGYQTIVVSDLLAYLNNGTPLPEKSVMLTFDDGYYNNYLYADPLLKKYRCRAVLSPIGIEADKADKSSDKDPLYAQCGWREIKEMAKSGVWELQCHSYDLHHLENGVQGISRRKNEDKEAYARRLQADLRTLVNTMEQKTGVRPTCMVYPFGAGGEEAEDIIRQAGFQAAMDCEEKVNVLRNEEDYFHLHRFLRPGTLSSREFFEQRLGMNN